MKKIGGVVPDGLVAALARAQAAFPAIAKAHINPHFKSKYADLSDVLAAVRPCLNAEGIWLTQPLGTDMDGRVRLFTRLEGHGEIREASLPLYLDNMTPQQLLSTLTYYRRGMLAALLGVAAAEDDDDGNAANEAPTAAPKPVAVTGDTYALAAATPPEKPLAAMTAGELARYAALIGVDQGGGKSMLLMRLQAIVSTAEGKEPWPVEGEGVSSPHSGVDHRAGMTDPAAPSRPEPDSIPFQPVVAFPNESGSARKVRDSIRRGSE